MARIQDYLDAAKAAIIAGACDRAMTLCQHILRHYPKHFDAHCLLGEAYRERGDTATAEDIFLRVLSADPEQLIARWALSILHEERGETDLALGHLRVALEVNPDHAELRKETIRLQGGRKAKLTTAGLARIYIRGGLFERAVTEFSTALGSEPLRLDLRVGLAEALWRAGRDREATEQCEGILQDSPDCLKALLIASFVEAKGATASKFDSLNFAAAQELDPENRLAHALLVEQYGSVAAASSPFGAIVITLPDSDEAKLLATNPSATATVPASAVIQPTPPSRPSPTAALTGGFASKDLANEPAPSADAPPLTLQGELDALTRILEDRKAAKPAPPLHESVVPAGSVEPGVVGPGLIEAAEKANAQPNEDRSHERIEKHVDEPEAEIDALPFAQQLADLARLFGRPEPAAPEPGGARRANSIAPVNPMAPVNPVAPVNPIAPIDSIAPASPIDPVDSIPPVDSTTTTSAPLHPAVPAPITNDASDDTIELAPSPVVEPASPPPTSEQLAVATPGSEWLPDIAEPAKPAAAELAPEDWARWADLLGEEITLDPEAESRLSAALHEMQSQQEAAVPQNANGNGAQSGQPDVDHDLPAPPTNSGGQNPLPSAEHAVPVHSESPAERLSVARSYGERGQWDAAVGEYRGLVKSAPELADQIAEALRDILRVVPDHAEAHRGLGDMYIKTGKFQQAINEYNQALTLEQTHE